MASQQYRPQLGHECGTYICNCGDLIQSCTCRGVKCVYTIDKGCYHCLDVEIVPLSKEEVKERLFIHVLANYWEDETDLQSIPYYFNALTAEGMTQAEVAAAFWSLDRIHALALTPDRKISLGSKYKEYNESIMNG